MLEDSAQTNAAWQMHNYALWKFFLSANDEPLVSIEQSSQVAFEIDKRFFFRTAQQFNVLERKALAKCSRKIIDIGACTGNFSLFLQNRGFDITACDKSEFACEIMRARKIVKIAQCDIFDLPDYGFNTFLMLTNGIGIVETHEKFLLFLQYIKSISATNASIIFDSDYYGTENEIKTFYLKYNGAVSECFRWFFPSPHTVFDSARKSGWNPSILYSEHNAKFLYYLTQNKTTRQ